jgi:hypothetical protein
MVAERVFLGHDPADEAMLRALVKQLQPFVAAAAAATLGTDPASRSSASHG